MSQQRLVKTKGSFVVTEDLMSQRSLLELCRDKVFSGRNRKGWACTTGKAGHVQ